MMPQSHSARRLMLALPRLMFSRSITSSVHSGWAGDVEQRVDLRHRAVDAPGLPHLAPAADEHVLRGAQVLLRRDGVGGRGGCGMWVGLGP